MATHFPRAFPFLLLLISVCSAPSLALAAEASMPGVGQGSHIRILPGALASFDCTQAKSIDEQLICSKLELARLDRRMGEVYVAAKATLPKGEKSSLLQTQRQWLSGHDQACGITEQGPLPDSAAECLTGRYQARTGELLALLTRGGKVIRELGGIEPWAIHVNHKQGEDNHRTMLQSCVGDAVEVGMCCPGGTESLENEQSSTTTFVINGRRYILFSAHYELQFHAPHGAYIRDENDDSGGYGTAPDVAPTPGSCSVVFAEQKPGSGDFAETDLRWEQAHSMAELLTGKGADTRFASELHDKLLPGDTITLAPEKGAARQYRWNAATRTYEESR